MLMISSIHRNHVPRVVEYFKQTGWTIQPPRSQSEVFRAVRRDHPRPIVLYRKNHTDFLLTDPRNTKILTKFIIWYNTKGDNNDGK